MTGTERPQGAILVLTHEIDPTADFVAHEFNRRNVPFIRLDLGEFPAKLSLSAAIDAEHDDWSGILKRPRRSVRLGDIRSVWWRRPTSFQFPEHLSREERWFARDEAAAALGGLLRLQDAFWMNYPESCMRAEFKPVQLKAARREGLEIPRTLISNQVGDVRAFIRDNRAAGRRTIYKTLAYADVINPVTGMNEVIYTSVVDEEDLDESLVEVTPCLFQAEVEKDIELRATVVGDQVFTAGIDASASPDGKIDFRTAYEHIRYEHVELPPDVSARLIRLVRNLGLTFGAIDLIRTPDGRHVFLEINPSGQWAWLESELGLPISRAICDALENGHANRLAERYA
ncbi:MvdC/MvdD family ATP grasp protein [Thermopolyspora sp. NPDC052614]|uniref:MvdC/MvdD family ATP grasp protein n=1 Tax=Thermopolyspora sp. NPDC052614 TaxID=3155682 RepID=UPI0034484030